MSSANGVLPEPLRQAIHDYLTADDLPVVVDRINKIRKLVSDLSPFAHEPVDFVEWVPADTVTANDYNPNQVAAPEMELLALSIQADGYTQPIVAMDEGDQHTVVDGFHRHRVGKENEDVRRRVNGYLPVVSIRTDREDRGDRIAATIRHNRARGKHQVIGMSDIVLELKRRNWSDDKIGRELGMDPDEVLRLAQITGLAEAFKDRDFSEAWQHVGVPEVEDESMEGGPVSLEWMRGAPLPEVSDGWNDRTENSSILYGTDARQRGMVQRSRFKDEWFWYVYTVPMAEGRAPTKEAAQDVVEQTYMASLGLGGCAEDCETAGQHG